MAGRTSGAGNSPSDRWSQATPTALAADARSFRACSGISITTISTGASTSAPRTATATAQRQPDVATLFAS
jgi:hypothetical protein